MDNKKLALLELIKTKINSFVKWDLVKFFYQNAATVDTLENIARYMGRKTEVLQPELEDLVDNGILEKKVGADRPVYGLATDETARTLVDQFIWANEDRFFRIKAVEQIVRGVR
jgi:hypothetical protein